MIKLINRCLSTAAPCLAMSVFLASIASADNSNMMSDLLQPPTFGTDGVEAHIAGGDQVGDPDTVPWMANLRNEYGDAFCGAVLVDSQNLLTAAHCVAQLVPNNFTVVFGGTTSSSDVHSVDRTWIPVGFRWSHLSEDYAVIHLQEPVDIEPLALADTSQVAQLSDGDMLRILGFGQLQSNGGLSQTLHMGEVPYVNPENCAARWQETFPSVANMILQENICASGDGYAIDTCLGDSGGPLLYNNGRWNLVGLTSFGEQQCGAADKPSVYTNVAAFSSVITKALNGESYYINWTQVLIGDDPSQTAQAISITNDSQQPWTFGAINAVAESPFQFDLENSNCENSTILPGDSCDLTLEFDPEQGGFAADRFLLTRLDLEPIWIDLQGFGYEYIPETRFGDQSIFGFTGGEVTPVQITSEGISQDGYLQWSNLGALENSEVYVGTGVAQTLHLYFDYQGTEEQKPNVKVQVLNAQAESKTLELDLNAGWQHQSFELDADDYLFVNIQGRGYGMSGTLMMDVASDLETSANEMPQPLSSNQQNTNTQDVQLETGGSLFWSYLLMCAVLVVSRFFKIQMQNRK